MEDFDDNQFDDFEEILDDEKEPTRKRKPGNRSFIIAAGGLGAIFLITLIALVVFASLIMPQRNAARQTEIANINAQNTVAANDATVQAVAQAAQATLESAASPTFTLAPIQAATIAEDQPAATAPAEPTNTSVIALATATTIPSPTDTISPLEAVGGNPEARTATVSALLTSVAGGGDQAQATSEGPITQAEAMTSTAGAMTATHSAAGVLPNAGIADDLGLPGMLAAAAVLIGIIVVVRRLRFAH